MRRHSDEELEDDEIELIPTAGPSKQNSRLFAFQNPYYDVITAMELDDDFEEDYHNPAFYDNRIPQVQKMNGEMEIF